MDCGRLSERTCVSRSTRRDAADNSPRIYSGFGSGTPSSTANAGKSTTMQNTTRPTAPRILFTAICCVATSATWSGNWITNAHAARIGRKPARSAGRGLERRWSMRSHFQRKDKSMNSNNKLAVYGERDEVREFTERLKATMPGGQRLSDVEARSLAQLSIAHQLDPFNGEAWIIPGSGLMVGIKGLRKKARQMSNDENSTYWTELRQVEPSKYQAGENAVVYECHLRDTITVQAWSKSIHDMTSAGVPYQEAVKYLGPSPVIIGVGISTTDERSKMGIHARSEEHTSELQSQSNLV